MSESDRDGWPTRIGDEAAGLIRGATIARRAGGASLILWVVLEIVFQAAGDVRSGIIGSLVFLVAGIVGLVLAIRMMAQARRVAAARLGLPPSDAKWVRLRHGTEGFDRWLSARSQPGWPGNGSR